MRARMTTGLFKFEQCNLNARDNELHVAFQDQRDPLVLRGIKDIMVIKQSDGARNVIVTTNFERFDFLLDGIEDKDVVELFFGLTEKSTRLQLRMD